MKKLIIMLLTIFMTLSLTGCEDLFSDLEIAFFNMNRIANVKMEIEMDGIPHKKDFEFSIITDGTNQITNVNDELTYTYIDENKNVYGLVMIDDQYHSYKMEQVGKYDLDISIVLELFLLSPSDFALSEDGYYRPIVVLYDFDELEFTIKDGYIHQMNFQIDLGGDSIKTSIQFNDINESTLVFPTYTQFTTLEQAEYFLMEDNHIIDLQDDGFLITVEDINIEYSLPNNYIEIIISESSFYYFPDGKYFKTDLSSQNILSTEEIVDYYQSSFVGLINFEYVEKYYLSFVSDLTTQEHDTLEIIE